MQRRFLVGDIGGTKTELALVSSGILFDRIEKFPSQKYESLEAIISKFLGSEQVDMACFGVAGPIKNGICHTTNLPWIIESTKISKQFNLSNVFLLNDLTANAYGVNTLTKESFYTLNKGEEFKEGNQVIISPGTGLGEALMIYDGRKHLPISSEGGHTDFAPRNEREIELYRYLRDKFSHVSYERILSGAGLIDLYSFLTDGIKKRAEEITNEALSSETSKGRLALKWFCEILGAEAGNLALKGYALGGVFVGGGIPPKILEVLKLNDFMTGFLDKGRFNTLLKTIPVHIILDPNTALRGAAYYCESQC